MKCLSFVSLVLSALVLAGPMTIALAQSASITEVGEWRGTYTRSGQATFPGGAVKDWNSSGTFEFYVDCNGEIKVTNFCESGTWDGGECFDYGTVCLSWDFCNNGSLGVSFEINPSQGSGSVGLFRRGSYIWDPEGYWKEQHHLCNTSEFYLFPPIWSYGCWRGGDNPPSNGTVLCAPTEVAERCGVRINERRVAGNTTFRVDTQEPVEVSTGDAENGSYTYSLLSISGGIVNIESEKQWWYTDYASFDEEAIRDEILVDGYETFSVSLERNIGASGGTCDIALLDPYEAVFQYGPDLGNWSTSVWDDYTNEAVGLCADGVSRAVIRIPAGPDVLSATVTIEAEDGVGGDIGGLSELDNSDSLNTIEISHAPPDYFIYCLYVAPDDFIRQESNGNDHGLAERSVSLTVTKTLSDASTEVEGRAVLIRRPPLVLLHGLWGNSGAFGDDVENILRDVVPDGPKRHVVVPDYSETNSSRFIDSIGVLQAAIRSACSSMRSEGFVSTQADVVAHSMGGCITRAYADHPSYYRWENYGVGDIHRFVTINSPMWGSNFANMAFEIEQICGRYTAVCPVLFGVECVQCSAFKLIGFVSSVGDFWGAYSHGAIEDLRENGLAVSSFGTTPMLSHATYSIYSGGWLRLKAVTTMYNTILDKSVSGAYCPPYSDAVVHLDSQIAGIPLSATTSLGDYEHSEVKTVDETAHRIVTILDTPTTEYGFWENFPPHQPFSSACPETYSASKTRAKHLADAGDISILYPVSGSAVGRNEIVTVQLASRALAPGEEIYLIGSGILERYASEPSDISWQVPRDIFGNAQLVAAIMNDTTVVSISDVAVYPVGSTAVLDSLRLKPRLVSLAGVGDAARVQAVGYYSDGGVKYFDQLDPLSYWATHRSIVSVDNAGTVV